MDRATRAKIDSLLYELRSWKQGECRSTAEALAQRFHLDPMLVRRIAQAEGIGLTADDHDADVDPNQATAIMSTDDLDLG
jgi:hypothetical protein